MKGDVNFSFGLRKWDQTFIGVLDRRTRESLEYTLTWVESKWHEIRHSSTYQKLKHFIRFNESWDSGNVYHTWYRPYKKWKFIDHRRLNKNNVKFKIKKFFDTRVREILYLEKRVVYKRKIQEQKFNVINRP